MKIKYKTKFNIGDKVVVHDFPHPGWYALGEVYQIDITINQFGVICSPEYGIHISGYGMKYFSKECLESIASFDKRQKETGADYEHYLKWLNEQNFAGVKK